MELSFDEIKSWKRFESLTAAYFRALKDSNPHIVEVDPKKSGDGSDGGRDILVRMRLTDGVYAFDRRWVVQCKYSKEEKALGKALVSDVNIPTLIHEYAADGYLLVSNSTLTSRLTEQFEHLQRDCKFGYKYEFWDGDEFRERIRVQPSVWPEYFPIFNRRMKELEKLAKV